MIYAIVDVGGHQMWVEPGKFYDVNHICADPGDIINLNRVLFFSKSKSFQIGTPCVNNVVVKARILKHIKGRKLTVFKIKPKKNARVKKGHRQQLTRLLIQEIVE